MRHLDRPVRCLGGRYYKPILDDRGERYAIYLEKTQGELGYTRLLAFVDELPQFELFESSKEYFDDLGPVIEDDQLDGMGGYAYLGCLFIEDSHTWPVRCDSQGRWYLLLGNCEWFSDDLEELERRLFEWSQSEQYDILAYIER